MVLAERFAAGDGDDDLFMVIGWREDLSVWQALGTASQCGRTVT